MRRSPLRKRRPLSKQTILQRLHKKAWALFSEYVRRSSKGICFSCGARKHWKELDAGHYIHGRLDYDELNIHAQCTYCNRYLHGNLGKYAERLLARHGEAALQELRLRANQVKKWEVA